MTTSALATRYASALVDVVTSPNSGVDPKEALDQLRSFRDLMQQSADLRNSLATPAVSLPRKRAVVDRMVTALGISRVIRNFLLVLTDKRRLDVLNEITEAFDILLDERLGFLRADVTSAVEMDESERAAVTEQLSRVTGKHVRTRFEIDKELIGGVVARVGSTVYDGSVRGQLAQMARRFMV